MSLFKIIRSIGVLLLSSVVLSSCGSGSCDTNSSNSGDITKLAMIAPNIITSVMDKDSYGYVTVYNPTESNISNVAYAISNPVGGGQNTSIDQGSASLCSIIAAYGTCTFKIKVLAGSIAGSIKLSAINANNNIKVANNTLNSNTAIVGIEQIVYNTLPGANGVTLYYYETIIAGVPYIMVMGVVSSDHTGAFNNVVLVDSNNNPIPNQQTVSGNLGAGLSNLAQGATFGILLPVPANSGLTQLIKVKTEELSSNGTVISSSVATNFGTFVTTNKVGIVNMLPPNVYLTAENPEQYITFSNTGDVSIQLQSLVIANPNEVEVVFDPKTLAPGETAVAILRLKNSGIAPTNTSITLAYNNGQETLSKSGSVHLNIKPGPNPSPEPGPNPTSTPEPSPNPTPTSEPGPNPTPTSEPSPTPTPTSEPTPDIGGISVEILPNDDFFVTTVSDSASRQVKITNMGSSDEGNIVFTLPNNFTLADGLENSCVINTQEPNKLRSILSASESCYITLVYTNNNVTSEGASSIAISYDYDYVEYENGIPGAAVNIPVNYRVSPASAILTLMSPWSPYNFTNIQGNGVNQQQELFNIYNSGESAALNVVGSLNPTSIFSIATNFPTTIAAGNIASLALQFGPSSVLGTNTTTLLIDYDSNATTFATPLEISVTGTVSNAVMSLFSSESSGFVGGNGQLSTTAYAAQIGTNGQITLVYKNTGNESATNFKLATGTINDKLAGTALTVITDGCNLNNGGITLAPDATCSEVLAYSPVVAGTQTLALNTNTWQYSYGDSHADDYTYNSAPIYFLAFEPARIVVTSNNSTTVNAGNGSANFTLTLLGGYNVPNQDLDFGLSPEPSSIGTGGSCFGNPLNSLQTSCTMNIFFPQYTESGVYTTTFTNSGSVPIESGNLVDITVLEFIPNILVNPIEIMHPGGRFTLDMKIGNSFEASSLIVQLPEGLKFSDGATSATCNIPDGFGLGCSPALKNVVVGSNVAPGYYTIVVTAPNGVSQNIVIAVAKVQYFVYIASSVSSDLLQVEVCNFNSNGVTNCINSGVSIAGAKLYGTTIAPNGLYAYVMSGENGINDAKGIYKCTINQTNKTLSACTQQSATGTTTNTRAGVVSSDGKFLYYNSMRSSSVNRCTIEANGDLSNCAPLITGLKQYVERLVIDYNGQYIFVNTGSGTKKCKLDYITGASLGCSDSGYNGASIGLTFTPNNQFIFFTQPMQACNISSNIDGEPILYNCVNPFNGNSGLIGFFQTGIAFSSSFAFITTEKDVYQCPFNPNLGRLEQCVPAANSNAPRAEGITVFN